MYVNAQGCQVQDMPRACHAPGPGAPHGGPHGEAPGMPWQQPDSNTNPQLDIFGGQMEQKQIPVHSASRRTLLRRQTLL